MALVAKLLSDIKIADIMGLISDGAAETQLLEFKETLPFKPTKGQPETADRWIMKCDRVGDFARDEILAEMVAFANADGGTLVLGLAEDDNEPARAREIKPLPRCADLAARLLSAAEDVIEPRLASLEAKPILIDKTGGGIVVLRCGRSTAGPHRLAVGTRDFYVRRGERTARMTAREIRDMSLQLARSGDRYDRLSAALRADAYGRFVGLGRTQPSDPPQWDRLSLRSAAIPATEMALQDLTLRREYFWRQNRIVVSQGGQPFDIDYPTRDFSGHPQIRLRALRQQMIEGDELFREVRGDGATTFELLRPAGAARRAGSIQIVYVGWCLGLFAGAIAQAEWVKRLSGNVSVTFGIEFEVFSEHPLALLSSREFWSARIPPSGWTAPAFPTYELAPGTDRDELINTFVRDLYNAWGANPEAKFSIDWSAFLPSLTPP